MVADDEEGAAGGDRGSQSAKQGFGPGGRVGVVRADEGTVSLS